MGIKLFLLGLLLVTSAAAENWRDPNEPFSTKRNQFGTVVVVWRPVDNVQLECEKANARRTGAPIGFEVEACSYNVNNVCYVITSRWPTQYLLGHEVRHCFQGAFHK